MKVETMGKEASMSATKRLDAETPAAPAQLWTLWVRQVDAITQAMGGGDQAFDAGLDHLSDAAAALGARKVGVVAAKADRHRATQRERTHLRHALRVGARLDARRALGA